MLQRNVTAKHARTPDVSGTLQAGYRALAGMTTGGPAWDPYLAKLSQVDSLDMLSARLMPASTKAVLTRVWASQEEQSRVEGFCRWAQEAHVLCCEHAHSASCILQIDQGAAHRALDR